MKSKVLLITALCIISPIVILAQGTDTNKKLSLKIGYSKTPKFFNLNHEWLNGNFRAEANYILSPYLQIGPFIGYSNFKNLENPTPGSQPEFIWSTSYRSDAIFYGINADFMLLPLFLKENKTRFDVYTNAKLGLISIVARDNSIYKGTSFDYGIYGGISFAITKSWGLYMEYGITRRVQSNSVDSGLRYGLKIKF